jgi:hypothetical protein
MSARAAESERSDIREAVEAIRALLREQRSIRDGSLETRTAGASAALRDGGVASAR